jgi:predicted Zn-dependent peptidase
MGCLDQILTGTLHSRIYGAARKKGLAYNVFSDTSVGFHDSSWDFGGAVNFDKAHELVAIIVREVKAVIDGGITQDELDAAKSYALGRHQMGAQTVSQISNFYSNRYFGDEVVKDYTKVPDAIRRISLERMKKTAQEFIQSNVWVLAAVSSGEKEELISLNEKLEELFPKEG